jgi:transcriptional regulator with XRE-family HTH domain
LSDPTRITFGKVLRKYRLQHKLSQEDLAELAGLDRTYISQLERGLKSPSIQTLFSLSKALQIKAHTLIQEVLIGGILLVPTKKMARYLTDRIGNFPELTAYFPFWRSQAQLIKEGILEIIAVEHDAESFDVPRISKNTDGRALL